MLWRALMLALVVTALGGLPGGAREHHEPDAWSVLAPVVRLNDAACEGLAGTRITELRRPGATSAASGRFSAIATFAAARRIDHISLPPLPNGCIGVALHLERQLLEHSASAGALQQRLDHVGSGRESLHGYEWARAASAPSRKTLLLLRNAGASNEIVIQRLSGCGSITAPRDAETRPRPGRGRRAHDSARRFPALFANGARRLDEEILERYLLAGRSLGEAGEPWFSAADPSPPG